MTSPRTILTTLALTTAAVAPAAAVAANDMSADYLPAIKAPATSPVSIHGGAAKATVTKGQKLAKGQSLLRVRVNGPAKKGIQLRLTCPSGFVTGYGYNGADAPGINGKRIFSRHTVRPKVQAAWDLNSDGRFTGVVYALCEGGHQAR